MCVLVCVRVRGVSHDENVLINHRHLRICSIKNTSRVIMHDEILILYDMNGLSISDATKHRGQKQKAINLLKPRRCSVIIYD